MWKWPEAPFHVSQPLALSPFECWRICLTIEIKIDFSFKAEHLLIFDFQHTSAATEKSISNNLCSSSFIWRVLIWSCSFFWESLICNFHQNLVIFNLFQPDLHFNKTSTWLACFSDSSCLLRSASASSLLQYKHFCDFARNKKQRDD